MITFGMYTTVIISVIVGGFVWMHKFTTNAVIKANKEAFALAIGASKTENAAEAVDLAARMDANEKIVNDWGVPVENDYSSVSAGFNVGGREFDFIDDIDALEYQNRKQQDAVSDIGRSSSAG